MSKNINVRHEASYGPASVKPQAHKPAHGNGIKTIKHHNETESGMHNRITRKGSPGVEAKLRRQIVDGKNGVHNTGSVTWHPASNH